MRCPAGMLLLGMALRAVRVHYSVFMDDASPAQIRAVALVVPAAANFGVIAIDLTIHFDTWSSHGGVFTQRFIALTFLLQQLGLVCSRPDTSCECFHNGEPLVVTARPTHDSFCFLSHAVRAMTAQTVVQLRILLRILLE